MIVGERIAALMEAQGVSQAELARRIGVKQPTVFKMLRANKTGSVHLHKVARELKTNPAYLSGETDDPSIDAVEMSFSPQDRDWLDLLHTLTPRDRNAVLVLARTLAGERPEPDPLPAISTFLSDQLAFKGAK